MNNLGVDHEVLRRKRRMEWQTVQEITSFACHASAVLITLLIIAVIFAMWLTEKLH